MIDKYLKILLSTSCKLRLSIWCMAGYHSGGALGLVAANLYQGGVIRFTDWQLW